MNGFNSRRVPAIETLERRTLLSIAIQYDYSLDTNGFFNNSDARQMLESATQALTDRLADTLAAITPSGSNTWTSRFNHPGTGELYSVGNLSIPADTIKVYAGARKLGGTTLGLGGSAGRSVSGSQAWLDTVAGRGETGALGAESNRMDYAPSLGVMSFDTTTSWNFLQQVSQANDSSDFFSVVQHEVAHVLGVGSSIAATWQNGLVGSTFQGAASMAVYGGPVPTDPGGDHWAEGTQSDGRETALDPTITKGTRKSFTSLDFAALDDIGWEVIPPTDYVIRGESFNDVNGNGTRSSDEVGIAGRTIFIDANDNDAFDAGERSTQSGADGIWELSGLGTGTFTVREVLPAGWTSTNPSGNAGAEAIVTLPAPVPVPPAVLFGSKPITTLPPPPPPTGDLRINAGGPAYTTTGGKQYIADGGFSGGTTGQVTVDITNTADDFLYGTRRFGTNFNFSKPIANGSYTLRLHFAETFWNESGKRKFNVKVEGQTVLSNFDLFAAVGYRKATTKQFAASITDGKLDLQFTGVVGDAIVSAVELVSTTAPPPSTVSTLRINAGGPAYTTTGGKQYVADNGFTGGTTGAVQVDITSTTDDALYGSRRFGTNFSFTKAVANGSYKLRLHFAETYWTQAGQRKFNVTAEGKALLNNFDLVALVGSKKATTKEFTVTITDGKLDLQFKGVVGDAIVSAIELVPA